VGKQKGTEIFEQKNAKVTKVSWFYAYGVRWGNHRLQRGLISETGRLIPFLILLAFGGCEHCKRFASRELEGPRLMSNLWALRCWVWGNRRAQRIFEQKDSKISKVPWLNAYVGPRTGNCYTTMKAATRCLAAARISSESEWRLERAHS
jgi:hypothetical protein